MRTERAQRIIADARRIGVVRTDHLGDMVLTLPLVGALRQEFPWATIVVIAHSRTAPLLEWTVGAESCMFVDRTPLELILRRTPYDALFFPRASAEEAWQAWCAGIPLRVGTRYRWWSALYNVRVPDHRRTAAYHEAEYNVRMLEYIIGKRTEVTLMRPTVPEAVRSEVEALLKRAGVDQRYIIVHPGGRGSAPQWAKFPVLATLLAERFRDLPIVITGVAHEAKLCNAIAESVPTAVNLCGALTLQQLIGVLEHAAVVVANSTGVLHIAASLGRAVVGIYPSVPASQSPARWRPLGERVIVCSASPIDAITATEVADAVCLLLDS